MLKKIPSAQLRLGMYVHEFCGSWMNHPFWRAKFLLANERSGIAAVPHSKKGVEALKKIAMSEQQDGKPLLQDPSFRDKVADLEVQLQALEFTELRILSAEAGGGAPGPEVSFLKIRGSEIQQRIISDHLLGKQKA